MLSGLDDVQWAALDSMCGKPSAVPRLLRGLFDPRRSSEALGELEDALFHQGGAVCSAATAALPFLVDAATRAERQTRLGVLELISWIAGDAPKLDEPCSTACSTPPRTSAAPARTWSPRWPHAWPRIPAPPTAWPPCSATSPDWVRVEAQHALWCIAAEPLDRILTGLAPETDGTTLPVTQQAVHYLARHHAPTPTHAALRALLDHPHRLSSSGGWRSITADLQIRDDARQALSSRTGGAAPGDGTAAQRTGPTPPDLRRPRTPPRSSAP